MSVIGADSRSNSESPLCLLLHHTYLHSDRQVQLLDLQSCLTRVLMQVPMDKPKVSLELISNFTQGGHGSSTMLKSGKADKSGDRYLLLPF